MKKDQQKPKGENVLDVLRRVAKRVEDATVDIHSIKSDLKFVGIRLENVEHNTKLMKIDMEKTREELDDKLVGLETRLSKRITHVADLITIQLGGKLQAQEKRIIKIERIQQTS